MDPMLKNLIRIGRIVEYHPDPNEHLVRVLFEDKPETKSYWLPILVYNTMKNKDYWMPDKGEQVVCLFLPNGNAQGLILGSFYQKVDRSPVTTEDKRNIRYLQFEDGTTIEYDRKTHTLTMNVVGPINIQADGNINVTGDVIANCISLVNHTHDSITRKPQ